MKISNKKLQKIIQEEYSNLLKEQGRISPAVEDSLRSFIPRITESPARLLEIEAFAVPVHS